MYSIDNSYQEYCICAKRLHYLMSVERGNVTGELKILTKKIHHAKV